MGYERIAFEPEYEDRHLSEEEAALLQVKNMAELYLAPYLVSQLRDHLKRCARCQKLSKTAKVQALVAAYAKGKVMADMSEDDTEFNEED